MSKTTIAITPGCAAGVGIEIAARSFAKVHYGQNILLLWCASASLLEEGARCAAVSTSRNGNQILFSTSHGPQIVTCLVKDEHDGGLWSIPGKPDNRCLDAQKHALLLAVDLAQKGKLDAMVTGPITKKALVDIEGHNFVGQTEVLHHFLPCDNLPPLMCFSGLPFLLGLATAHLPQSQVASALSTKKLIDLLTRLATASSRILDKPLEGIKIAVLGLNPHAGEDGLLGHEEKSVISPAINSLRKSGLNLHGPLPADGFFASLAHTPRKNWPNALMAMYHDQGLAPYKALAREGSVNITLGIKVPRTSPGHGTAYDIAGKNIAMPDSMIKAIFMAKKLANNYQA